MIDDRTIKRTCFYCVHFEEPRNLFIGDEGRWPHWGWCPKYKLNRTRASPCPLFYNTGENSWDYCGDLELTMRGLQR